MSNKKEQRVGLFMKDNVEKSIEDILSHAWIGLYDKNGRKILEGDIVSLSGSYCKGFDREIPHLVYFKNGGFSPFSIHHWENEPNASDVVVIGNKYDNPEMEYLMG